MLAEGGGGWGLPLIWLRAVVEGLHLCWLREAVVGDSSILAEGVSG